MSNFTNEKKAALVTAGVVICIAVVVFFAYIAPEMFHWLIVAAGSAGVIFLIYRFILEMFFEDDNDYYGPY